MTAERLEEIREIVKRRDSLATDTDKRVGYPGARESEMLIHIDALTARVAELERQVVDWTVRAGRQVERADAAEAKLEQAALIVEGQSVAVNHLPPSIGGNSLATFLTERDFKAANQIRALQTKDTTP